MHTSKFNYPENLALSHAESMGKYGQMIYYFDTGIHAYQKQKAGIDHVADMRKADASLLACIADNYYCIARRVKFISIDEHQAYQQAEALELLGDSIKALRNGSSTRKEFNPLNAYSPALISLAASCITLSLTVIGYHKVIDTVPGAMRALRKAEKTG